MKGRVIEIGDERVKGHGVVSIAKIEVLAPSDLRLLPLYEEVDILVGDPRWPSYDDMQEKCRAAEAEIAGLNKQVGVMLGGLRRLADMSDPWQAMDQAQIIARNTIAEAGI